MKKNNQSIQPNQTLAYDDLIEFFSPYEFAGTSRKEESKEQDNSPSSDNVDNSNEGNNNTMEKDSKTMTVEIISLDMDELEEYDYQDEVEIKIDGKRVFFVNDGEPEDSNLSRNFRDVYKIDELMKIAYEAGKQGVDVKFSKV